ncbi:MAG: glucose-6-phosphate isomerase, partial [Candidatus Sedimenticola sp. 6PFRAG1]
MNKINECTEWHVLEQHWNEIAPRHMRELFQTDPQRFDRMSLQACGLLLDYSKNLADAETMTKLQALAEKAGLVEWIQRMFNGERINNTEHRAVLHTALRTPNDKAVVVDGEDVMPAVHAVLQQMERFTSAVRDGSWLGYTGKRITDVVNIGIGGSNLGPLMVAEALKHYQSPELSVHFVSNVDGTHLAETLKPLNPETTLFIIA